MGKRIQRVLMKDIATVPMYLGYSGENEHTIIRFSCLEIFNDHPNAETLLAVQNPRGEITHPEIERSGIQIIWEVLDDDVEYPGTGRLQLTFTDGEEIIKTAIGTTSIDDSLRAVQGG